MVYSIIKALFTATFTFFFCSGMKKNELPFQFVYLQDIDNTIIENSRYFGKDNFTGQSVPGYSSPHIIASSKAAEQLKLANQYFKAHGYQIVVYDGYRPQIAVDTFYEWAKNNSKDNPTLKRYFYPTLTKKEISGKYIKLHRSSHSRGSTFDLTLIKSGQRIHDFQITSRVLANGQKVCFLDDNTLDMGTSFDLFHPASQAYSKLVSKEAQKRREFLRQGMQKFGFKAYKYEWWHFQLIDEPYPRTYFNFF